MDSTTKILIADENQAARRAMSDGIRRAGFTAVYETSNGEEALELSGYIRRSRSLTYGSRSSTASEFCVARAA